MKNDLTLPFSQLTLSPAMRANLDSLGYTQMTPVQAQGLPVVLEGKDLIAQAQTGSGKTAAFGIGLLERLQPRSFKVQALVLCPTRELADQVSKVLRQLARQSDNIKIVSLCGGVAIGPQIGSLEHGAHIVVGTPGRIQDHLRKGTLNLSFLRTLVLDEADRMLDMGFLDSIREIIALTPTSRQTLLFSATFPEDIRQLSLKFQHDPVTVTITGAPESHPVEQQFFEVDPEQRLPALLRLLSHARPELAVVFCTTRLQCDTVAASLREHGLHAQALHGDLEQRDRDQVLVQFTHRSCTILVATDVAARGLDIDDLPLVINYELARDPEIHVHRIGRTGRAGKRGLALNLCSPSEAYRAQSIEELLKQPLQWVDLKTLRMSSEPFAKPAMVTLCIAGGRKEKLRPGDIVGALTADAGLPVDGLGRINVFDFHTYVAVRRDLAVKALHHLEQGKIKGRKFKARSL